MSIRSSRSLICTVLAVAAVGAGAAPAWGAPAPPGPVVSWGGMSVQSLDPFPLLAGAAQVGDLPVTPPGSSPPPDSGSPPPPDSGSPPPDSGSPPPPSGPQPAPGAYPNPGDVILSNERTWSRWSYTAAITAIRARPDARSPALARTRWYTEDGFPEVYLLLRSHRDSRGRQWIQLRIPMRPNGRVGWVPRGALGDLRVSTSQIVVDRRHVRMYFYDRGRRLWSAPVGVGAPGTPTPAGRFWIRERFKILDRASGYWPYAFGTADYSTISEWPGGGVVGIHGPYYEASRIPGHISHGCIRLRTFDAAWLARHAGVGTPLRVI
jgi:hypothetical protein